MAKTHYQVLGISQGASIDEVKRAYRAKVKVTHPDRGGSRAEFEAVQTAFETLSNASTRRSYDSLLATSSKSSSSRPAPPRRPAGPTTSRPSDPLFTPGPNADLDELWLGVQAAETARRRLLLRLQKTTDPQARADLEQQLTQASRNARAMYNNFKLAADRAGIDVSDRDISGSGAGKQGAPQNRWQARPSATTPPPASTPDDIIRDPGTYVPNQTYGDLFLRGPAYLRLTWRWRWRAGIFLAVCGVLAWLARITGALSGLAGTNGNNENLVAKLEPYLGKQTASTALAWAAAGLLIGVAFWVAPLAAYHIANIPQRIVRFAACGLVASGVVLLEFLTVPACLVVVPLFVAIAIALSYVPTPATIADEAD